MSRLYEALSGLRAEHQGLEPAKAPVMIPPPAIPPARQDTKPEHRPLKVFHPPVNPTETSHVEPLPETERLDAVKAGEQGDMLTVPVRSRPESHLVAWTSPNSLGAEKFRALVTRFDHLRGQRQLRSFQVTSSVINEGKSLVAANVGITFARYSGSKTLLVEGDLHRPTLGNLFGLTELRGLNHWWASGDQELGKYVYRLSGMPLWFLPSGNSWDQPSDMLRSERFQKAFQRLTSQFEWTVVDSTPMLPIVDVNLWSKLLDGTLLVVREGLAPVKALKRGLQALDHPKLIGVVINEATELDHVNYEGKYYGDSHTRKKSPM